MTRITGVGPDTSSIPALVILYLAIASLAGSAAAVEVATLVNMTSRSGWALSLASSQAF
jgi:hypothetical protein